MACKLTCGKHGMLWPLPTGLVAMSESLAEVLPGDFVISVSSGTDLKVQVKIKLPFSLLFACYHRKKLCAKNALLE